MKIRTSICTIFCVFTLALGSTWAFAHEKEDRLGEITTYVKLWESYLTVADKWMQMASSEDAKIFFVAEKIAEIYKDSGQSAKALEELQAILQNN